MTSFLDDPGAPRGRVEAVSIVLVRALAEFDDLDIHIVTTKRNYSLSRNERWGRVDIRRLPWAGWSTLRNLVGPGWR